MTSPVLVVYLPDDWEARDVENLSDCISSILEIAGTDGAEIVISNSLDVFVNGLNQ